ncbi:PA14 domain-containing protein [Streptomyces sp. HD]|uniref:PA14 domain-containing protein n=1 Tax=Streptomyces sp. HD TaxID=3020892 RepID=UPI00232E55E0|nr:PA14 domain-containing protein [Streptomyces sp. HD]MDC0769493.1 PA14 domain-containing protein [Streptomyces sp. HD]
MPQKSLVAAVTGGALSAVVLGSLLAVAPQAAAADVTCATNVYKRTFYKNTSFSGTPVRTDCDSAIDQSWSGAPLSGMPSNNFGVRWSVTRDFGSGGPFTFTASATDGVRVYLDGTRKIDLWQGTGDTPRSKSVNLTVPSGKHTIRVDHVNWSGAAKVKYSYTPRTSATYDGTKPLAPTGVKTAYNTTTRRTTVSWSANKEMDLASYSLYRRPVGSGTWTKVTTTTARGFTDPLVNPDDRTPYYYEVRAKDKAGNTSSGSTDVIVRPLPVVTSLTGTYDKATGNVSLTWPLNTEPHFDHYTVLSNDKVDGSYVWVPLGTTKGNDWTTGPVTADGETRHYRVLVTNDGGTTTYNPAWLDANATNELWLAVPDGIAPAYAPDLALASCATGIQATASDSTPPPIRDFIGFEIERREAGTETWSVVLHKTFDPRLDPAKATVCDPLPSDGRTYQYRARTYDAAENHSPYSEMRALTVPVG